MDLPRFKKRPNHRKANNISDNSSYDSDDIESNYTPKLTDAPRVAKDDKPMYALNKDSLASQNIADFKLSEFFTSYDLSNKTDIFEETINPSEKINLSQPVCILSIMEKNSKK